MILHDKQALELFNKRGEKYTDVVVLVDNSSSVDTMKSSSPIALLKKSLEKLDNATDYKRIAVLKGGFEEWSSTYPDFVWRYKKKSSMNVSKIHVFLASCLIYYCIHNYINLKNNCRSILRFAFKNLKLFTLLCIRFLNKSLNLINFFVFLLFG